MRFKGLSNLFMAVVIIAGALIIASAFTSYPGEVLDNFLDWLGLTEDSSEPRVYTNAAMKVLKLQVAQLDRVVVAESKRTYFSALPDAKVKVMYQGTVTTGFDMARVSDQDFVFEGNQRVTIRLPYPQILNCQVSQPDTQDSQCGAAPNCSEVISDLQEQVQRKAINKLREVAQEENFLAFAYSSAKEQLADLFYRRGFAEVVFIDPVETPFIADDTCYPD